MPEYIGSISIPTPPTTGTFPIALDYGMVRVSDPQTITHQFGSGDAQMEQRFYLGTGARRFQVSYNSLSAARKVSLVNFYNDRKGSYEGFTLNVKERDNSTTSYTVRFANPNLTLQQIQNSIWSGSVELVEVPTTAPSFTSSSTQTRFPNSTLKTALLSQVQEVFPIVKVKATDNTTFYISDRKVTVDGNLYQPRILDWSGISQSMNGSADTASFTLGNADRVFTQLVNVVDLDQADIEFSLFHVGTTTKLDLWKGHVTDWSFDSGPTFQLSASDGLYQLRLPYPSRKITRQDGFIVGDQPVNVGGKKGISNITATSVINDTAYGKALRDVYVYDSTHPLPVKCDIIAGRDESEFFAALGVIGRGPISAFGAGHTLDSKQHHGPGNLGLRRSFGGNYTTGSETAQNNAPDAGSDKFALDNVSGTYPPDTSILDGVSFLQIRTVDEKGIQPTNGNVSGKSMVAYVGGGLGCYTWSGVGSRSFQVACTNPIWIAINTLLYAKGKYNASVSEQEKLFDVASAVTAAGICDSTVDKIVGTGTEKQFTFTGVIEAERPLRDWIQEILGSCLAYHTFAFGKLKVGIRFDSSVVEPFTVGNIVHNSLRLSAFKPEYNDLTVSFADVEYGYQQNALNLSDIDSVTRIGEKLKSNINLVGVSTKSQAARICTTKLREVLGGLNSSEQLKARQIAFKTTVLALNTEPGMVCSMTHSDMPSGSGEFRVQSWTLNRDYSIDIAGSTTTDNMYNMLIGDKPTDVPPDEIPVPANAVPSDVVAIGAEPFLLENVTNAGVIWTGTVKYNPPASTDPFNGVAIWIEDPKDSANYVFIKNYDYDGDISGSGAARYGTADIMIPLPLDEAKEWNLFVCPKSAFHTVRPSSGRPHKTIDVAKATFDASATVPTQPASGDWSVSVAGYTTDPQTGKQIANLQVTVTTVPSDVDYLQVWQYKGSTPPTDPADYTDVAAKAKADTGDTVIDWWVDREDVDTVYQVVVMGCTFTYTAFPSATTPAKSVTVTDLDFAPQPTGFNVTVVTGDNGGVKSGRFKYDFTKPNSDDYAYTIVERIWCNSSFVPVAGQEWGIVMTTGDPLTQTDWWVLPDAAEYWKFRASAVNNAGMKNETSQPTVNVTVPANGGTNLGKAQNGSLTGDKIAPTTITADKIDTVNATSVHGIFTTGSVTVNTQDLTGTIQAGGSVTVNANALTGTITSGGPVTVSTGALFGTIAGGGAVTVNVAALSGTITGGGPVTVNTSALIGTITGGGNVTINTSALTGTIAAGGNVTISTGALSGVIQSGGAVTVNANAITGVIVTSQLADNIINSVTKIDSSIFAYGIAKDGSTLRVTHEDQSNLLDNPGFEFDLKGWINGAGSTISTTSPLSGTKCLRSVLTGVGPVNYTAVNIPCRPGDQFVLDIWSRAESGASGTIVPIIRFLNSSGTGIGDSTWVYQGPNLNWTKTTTGITTAPTGAVYVQVYAPFFYNAVGTWYIDSAMLSRVVDSTRISSINFSTTTFNGILAAGYAQVNATDLVVNGTINIGAIPQITAAKIANLAVTGAAIDNLTITGTKIANATIDNIKINSVSADKITAGTITATISMTSPSLTCTGTGIVTYVNATDGVKVISTTGQSQASLGAGNLQVSGTGTYAGWNGQVTSSQVQTWNSTYSAKAYVTTTAGYLECGLSSNYWTIAGTSSGSYLWNNGTGAYISLYGSNSYVNTTAGYRVNGTSAIDSARNFNGASLVVTGSVNCGSIFATSMSSTGAISAPSFSASSSITVTGYIRANEFRFNSPSFATRNITGTGTSVSGYFIPVQDPSGSTYYLLLYS